MHKEDKLFFWGLFTLTLSLFLIPFGFYLLPAAWLGWQYSIPEFILNFTLWMQTTFHTTYGWAFVWVARLIFLPGIFFGVVAYSISRRLNKMKLESEGEIEENEEEEEVLTHKASEELNKETKDSLMLLLKIAGIAALVFVVANAIQMVISVAPPR